MSARSLNLVFSSDEAYIPHFAAALTSALENNRGVVGKCFLLTDAGDSEAFLLVRKHIKNRYDVEVIPLNMPMEEVQNLQVTGHISRATYFRFLIATLVPKDIETVLYLDCDLVVNGNLEEILESEAALHRPRESKPYGYGIGAIRRDESVHLRRFGFESDLYFNAGVLLINLTYWRHHDLRGKLISRATELHGKLDLWDQDVLNLEFEDNWLQLPGRFNVTTVDDLDDDAVIIHFAGSTKPWMVGNKHPKAELYRQYRSLTPFYPYKREQLGRYLHRRLVPKVFRDWKKTKRRTKRSINRFLRRLKQSLG